ncbi:lysophospholipid acyltransferase family protein [Pseudorhodobacter sp.]|uniref:lysophospholipid acyltransferase family protein n=1 Tax=Pseudorhodobacter sp. TaxID=1934400 RepID=UPI0026483649|nr:lysophospholipid acyltransferase family protein [Pseudorhodobacter sp.]MDN5787659.1 lysophospholipid acyltransferase family protein [Pseudorhodobacter sp.]
MPDQTPEKNRGGKLRNVLLRGLIGLLLALPYRWRVPLCGWVMAYIIAPVAGYDKRVRDNLALILPNLPQREVKRLMREVPRNVGRTLIEIYSGAEFIARATAEPLQGAGLAALDEAHAAGRPVILVTGHFGNYDASRAALIARGYRVGALYRPMGDADFNAHYVKAISQIGTPVFPRGRAGLADMVRFLRSGGMLGLLMDQQISSGVALDFMGHPARTALSAADLALKYDALVIPTYAVRRAGGLDFDIIIESPIPHDTPEAMTQALNASLEKLVRQYPDQWFWIHRRWK